MARDAEDKTPIHAVQQLAAALESGCKPPDAFCIGTEHEKFGFTLPDHRPLKYEGRTGVQALLEGMQARLGWQPIYDNGKIIGLYDEDGGGAISIEPGGQFELSGAPLPDLHRTCREANNHLVELKGLCDPLGIGFIGIGMAPDWSRGEMPIMPKSRYEIMTRYMPKKGQLGLDMMYRTATIQVNLDFSSEADMVKKLRVALALQPIATAIFANSPFTDGKINGYQSYRAQIWRDVDPDRTGGLEFAFEEDFGFARYVEWALDVPMYFIKREAGYIDATDVTFRQYMRGALQERLKGDPPNMGDWNNHLSSLFPEVRLKTFLEMRGADGGPWLDICALPAFWVGLLYDNDALEAAWQLIRGWSADDREFLRRAVPRLGLKTIFHDRPLLQLALQAVEIAQSGLRARARLTDQGDDETIHLAPILRSLKHGRSPADWLIDQFRGSWDGDMSKIYSDYAF